SRVRALSLRLHSINLSLECVISLLHYSSHMTLPYFLYPFFFFTDPATTEIYTLSLHDALPILIIWSGARADDFLQPGHQVLHIEDRKSTRLNSSHVAISYAVFCLKKKNTTYKRQMRAR